MDKRAFDLLPGTGSYEWVADQDRITWSDGLLAIFGRSSPPANEREFNALVHPADRARIEAANSRLVQGGDSYVQQYRIIRADGAIRLIDDRGVIERDAAGRAIAFRGINVDVTEQRSDAALREALDPSGTAKAGPGAAGGNRHDARRHLAQSGALADAIFDEAPVGIGVWDLDFRFVRVNERLAEMNGLPAHAHIGRKPDEVLPTVSDVDEIYRIWQKIVDTGKPLLNVEVTGETAATPGQSRHWCEHFFPIRIGGEVAGIAAVVEDVTERKMAQGLLQKSEERLRKILDNTIALTALLDLDGRLREVNAAAVAQSGKTRAQLLGGRLWDLPPWKHAPEAREQLRAAVQLTAGGEVTRFDTVMTQPDGTVAKVELLMAPLRGSTGRVEQIVCSGFDITERQAANEHIKFLMQELGHRSKNMLALVQAVARQLGKTGAEDFVDRFVLRLQALSSATDVLVKGDWKGADLGDLARSQLGHFADLIGHRIFIDGPPVTVSPRAAQALGMAFYELATNAGKHGALTVPTGRIDLRWQIGEGPGDPKHLGLSWVESEGPAVRAPLRSGFGFQVTGPMLERSLGATVKQTYEEDGFGWELSCPLDEVERA